MTDPAQDLELITQAAFEAGALALKLRSQGLETTYKEGDSPVTNADLATDALIKQLLTSARPDYGWLSEETADDPARRSRRRLFVVDPIDGTRAFIKNRPWWAVSVAVVEDDKPIAGVVFAPDVDETYQSIAGAGATLNGQAIHASDREVIEGCGMVGDARMFAHPAWPAPWPPMRIEARNSTAYRLCIIAAGAFDATLALVAKFDWDLAAADLIAREAGAFVGDHRGRPFVYNGAKPAQPSLVCAAPRLAPLILERVRHIDLPN
ncbi:3'(2'),5'-bisphosphate nucleotidase CysQ [Phenylobacterium sp.]|uniref:3'(2'),5'-bisphosphate nucleotidase CysQ n=1 Tax=Phenylobacterium sp. TaxID=1871053 RepID=UPI0028982CDA|nr:3'(2'),5'-bisphosphate nucleotidase CysQ [Phenylobacterium sp.]